MRVLELHVSPTFRAWSLGVETLLDHAEEVNKIIAAMATAHQDFFHSLIILFKERNTTTPRRAGTPARAGPPKTCDNEMNFLYG